MNAVVVAKTLDHAHAEDKVTSLEIHCEGTPSARGVSHSNLLDNGANPLLVATEMGSQRHA